MADIARHVPTVVALGVVGHTANMSMRMAQGRTYRTRRTRKRRYKRRR